MSRIQAAFAALNGRRALITYITAGDPSAEVTAQLLHTLADNGADVIELGVPFSDPMADGPTIQRAAERALAAGMNLRGVLALVAEFRQRNHTTPVVLMGYLNPVHRMGYAEFAAAAAQAGVDGVLTVDCPAEEIDALHGCLKQQGLDCIFLVAPTTTEARMAEIARRASGFVYYVSLKGVTGAAHLDVAAVAGKIERLRQYTDLPIGVGFGITDEASAAAVAQIADAVIVGSRLVQTIEAHPGGEAAALAPLVRALKTAVDGV